MGGGERLQKIISRAGLASRRAAEALILAGRVTVDGQLVRELGTRVDAAENDIRLDGVRVKADRPRRYLVLHKPRGYVTTRSDPGGRPTVMQLLPPSLRSLVPVGRLDMNTSGVLILTDDGGLAHRVMHPRFGVEKTYRVTVEGCPSDATMERLRRGLQLDGETLSVSSVELLNPPLPSPRQPQPPQPSRSRLRVVLREGRYREIRRLFEVVGHPVERLHRERVGPLNDRGLPPGTYRMLRPDEIAALQSGGTARHDARGRRGKKRPA